eukprot:scaffold3393_cov101-Isochrysis_galbana.AAC.2
MSSQVVHGPPPIAVVTATLGRGVGSTLFAQPASADSAGRPPASTSATPADCPCGSSCAA